MNNKHFAILALASLLSSLTPLVLSGNEDEVRAFTLVVLMSLTAIGLLLALTRKYWKGARSVR